MVECEDTIPLAGGVKYVIGDATRPEGPGMKIIAHVCNNVGAWGAGFVVAVSRCWRGPEIEFRRRSPMRLGSVDFVPVESSIVVANMCGQHGIRRKGGVPPIRYDALRMCLGQAASRGATVHMPRIGSGLAGGDWNVIEAIIREEIVNQGIDVYVYDLPLREDTRP